MNGFAGQSDIVELLTATGEHLAAEDEEVGIVVLGGAALNLLGVVHRTTRDVDVVALGEAPVPAGEDAEIRPPRPLPEALVRAIETVARDFGLPDDWMNATAGLQWRTGLPPGLESRLEWRRFAGLHVGLVSRYDLIHFKLYAAADSKGPESVHYQDLLALEPSAEELAEAAAWVRQQDPSPGFATILDDVLTLVREDVG